MLNYKKSLIYQGFINSFFRGWGLSYLSYSNILPSDFDWQCIQYALNVFSMRFPLFCRLSQHMNDNHICVFWDPKLNGGAWSTHGCTKVNSDGFKTVCSCEHLSTFAVLMALYDIGVCVSNCSTTQLTAKKQGC